MNNVTITHQKVRSSSAAICRPSLHHHHKQQRRLHALVLPLHQALVEPMESCTWGLLIWGWSSCRASTERGVLGKLMDF